MPSHTKSRSAKDLDGRYLTSRKERENEGPLAWPPLDLPIYLETVCQSLAAYHLSSMSLRLYASYAVSLVQVSYPSFVFFSVYLPICLPICLATYLSIPTCVWIFNLPLCLSVDCVSILSLPVFSASSCLSIHVHLVHLPPIYVFSLPAAIVLLLPTPAYCTSPLSVFLSMEYKSVQSHPFSLVELFTIKKPIYVSISCLCISSPLLQGEQCLSVPSLRRLAWRKESVLCRVLSEGAFSLLFFLLFQLDRSSSVYNSYASSRPRRH